MKKSSYKIVLVLALCLTALVARADVFDDVAAAIKTANAAKVATYFAPNVELRVGDKSGNYSKSQAEVVLKDFFDKNPVRNFKLIHRGSSAQGAQYAIGTYEAAQGVYRVYIYLKNTNGSSVIQELSFEKK